MNSMTSSELSLLMSTLSLPPLQVHVASGFFAGREVAGSAVAAAAASANPFAGRDLANLNPFANREQPSTNPFDED